MTDRELKELLLETCPVQPGQENRAWLALRKQLNGAKTAANPGWLSFSTWRGFALSAAACGCVALAASALMSLRVPVPLATADSQSPGIYATSFYSHSAQAQVVWLNGMEPASDKLTYLDPTTVIAGRTQAAPSDDDPNSL